MTLTGQARLVKVFGKVRGAEVLGIAVEESLAPPSREGLGDFRTFIPSEGVTYGPVLTSTAFGITCACATFRSMGADVGGLGVERGSGKSAPVLVVFLVLIRI